MIQLRHPNILSFKDTAEIEERGETVIYIVTEEVSPLTLTLNTLSLEDKHREQYVSMGLQQIVSAVSFLNNDCKFIHGNVCFAAVVVTPALDWKLHGFDLTTEHQWPTAMGSSIPLAAASWMVAAQYKPGELAKSDFDAIRDGPSWAVDAWGLGCLIQEIYSNRSLARTEDLRVTDTIPKMVLQYYQRLLSSQPSRRLNPSKILDDAVLANKLGETMSFLENLSLKDAIEKDSFFKKLPSNLPHLPRAVAQKKLLPLLAGALEFGGAPPIALSTLLKIGEGMSEEEKAVHVIPVLSKLFASNDRGIRRGLLENISSFGQGLPNSLVEEQIYPSIQNGFTDANPYLRELTLKAMVILGPKLSQKTLNQSVLKHLAKLQVDEEPAIRANTTVLLGNLAQLLSEATCRKILLNAFTRALKDPFPPARAAGVRAILNTEKYYSAEDVATRVIPIVGPLCIDGVQEVRISALQCLEHFFATLQDHNKELERRAASSSPGDVHGTTSSGATATSTGMGNGSGGLLTGFGWAVSSIVSSSTGNGTIGGSKQGATATMTGFGSTSSSRPAASTSSSSTVHAKSFDTMSMVTDSGSRNVGGRAAPNVGGGWDDIIDDNSDRFPGKDSRFADDSATAAIDSKGGWGDDDDDPLEDMMDAVAAEMEARKKLTEMSIGKSTVGAKSIGSSGGGGGGDRSGVGGGGRKAVVGVRRGPGAGMKLGAKKLNEDEDDFNSW